MYDFEKIKILQVNLDERKYLESINNNRDMSGYMPYCDKCVMRSSNGCNANQAIRQDLKQCARAYLLSDECDKKMYEIDSLTINSRFNNASKKETNNARSPRTKSKI